MSELKLDLTLLRPLSISVNTRDGPQVYSVRRLTRTKYREIKELEDRARAGDLDAYYAELEVVTDIPVEVINEMELAEVKAVIDFILRSTVEFLRGETKEEKNGSKPGETPLP